MRVPEKLAKQFAWMVLTQNSKDSERSIREFIYYLMNGPLGETAEGLAKLLYFAENLSEQLEHKLEEL